MNSPNINLEEMDVLIALEEEEDGGVILGEKEQRPSKNIYALMGKFLTEKNINFNAMWNVLASL